LTDSRRFDEVRDFLDTELPARWEKSTEWCEHEDFWAFATAFTRKVSARGWIGLTWPKACGGLARPPIDQLIFSEEFTRRCRHWELDIGHERYHRERIADALAA